MFGVIDFHSDRYSVGDEEGEPGRDVRVCAQKPLLVGQTTPTRTHGNFYSLSILRLRDHQRWGRNQAQERQKERPDKDEKTIIL